MNGSNWNDRDEWEFLLGCLQEDASVGVEPSTASDNVESSTATITTGPAIVQGVK